jgi:hypothetical protein
MRKGFYQESTKYGGASDNLDTISRSFQIALDDYGIIPDEGVRVTHLMLKGSALDYYLSHVRGSIDRSSRVHAFHQAMRMISDKFLSDAARQLELKTLQAFHVSSTICSSIPTYQSAVQVLAERVTASTVGSCAAEASEQNV